MTSNQDPYRDAGPKQSALPIHHAYADDEHLRLALSRGKYDANAYVFFGAVYQAAIVAALVGVPLGMAIEALTAISEATTIGWVVGAVVGIPAAVFTYWGRWARVEAFASRFCSGVANLSMLYVPVIAFVQANVLLVQDLFGRSKRA